MGGADGRERMLPCMNGPRYGPRQAHYGGATDIAATHVRFKLVWRRAIVESARVVGVAAASAARILALPVMVRAEFAPRLLPDERVLPDGGGDGAGRGCEQWTAL